MLRLRLYAAVLLVLGISAGWAQQKPRPSAAAPGEARKIMASTKPNDLVARMVENEIHAHDQGSYMYRDFRETPDGSKTKEMIETSMGTVARLIAVNNKPLTPEQRGAEDARLQGLLKNPDLQRKRQKDQEQDEKRVNGMIRELPKAFIYQYEGTERGADGEELIRMKFTPNPNYQPSSREHSVFKAMAGQLWVAVPGVRMGRIEATLFRDISFGWGILGHLDKGGHFFVAQSKVGPDHWEATYMNIQFTGKALLFKTINLRQVEKLSNFREVPDKLTLAQGIDLLNKSGKQLAENGGTQTQ